VRTLEDLDVEGKRVLVRVDFNVPLDEGRNITDDARIRAALPTLRELREKGARLVLLSHLGRPKGRDEKLSLRPAAERLSELLETDVALAPDLDDVPDADVVMVENVRFFDGETKNDSGLAERYAALADVYVNDAFGSAHRAHASTEAVAHLLPSAAGRLLEREVTTLTGILEDPKRPLVAVVGGAKVTDKIGVLEAFLERADSVLIGGAMCFPFFKAEGHDVGSSLCEEEGVEPARKVGGNEKLELPTASSRPTPRCASSTASTSRTAGWGSTSARARPSATRRRSPGPAPCSGTGRWGRSSSSRSPPARRRSPRRWPRRTPRRLWAAATPRRRSRSSGWPTGWTTSPPAAAPRWSSSRARSCPA
jgi:3-phosphoglycerate kinase